MSDAPTDAPTDASTDKPSGDPGDTPKTFTQDQVNDLLARQKGDVQRKFADYDDLKAKADKLAEIEAEKQTDLEKANGKVETLTSEVGGLKAENVRLRVAMDKKLPPELASRLQGKNEEELAADADKLLEMVKTDRGDDSPAPQPDFNGGARQPTDDPKKPEDQHNEDVLGLLGLTPTNT